METRFDVIVVGGGPGGSSAAINLARGGAKVLLLDKFDFPRDKPCGDFIGRQAYALAQKMGVSPTRFSDYAPLTGVKMRTPTNHDLNLPGERAGAGSRIIPRTVFDTALVELSVAAGATLRRWQIQSLIFENSHPIGVAGRDNGEKAFAPLIIGADGWSSVVARSLGLSLNSPATTGVAVRAYFENVRGLDQKVAFHFPASILPGYGWLFPVGSGGEANVGLGLIVEEYDVASKGNLHQMFERFVAQTEFLKGAKQISKTRTWPLALGWQAHRPLATSGAMLVGDAACLVGPLTGAGIYPAMRSGMLAAQTSLAALEKADFSQEMLNGYARKVQREFRWRLQTEQAAQKWLRDPNHLDKLLRSLRFVPFSNQLTTNLLFNLG